MEPRLKPDLIAQYERRKLMSFACMVQTRIVSDCPTKLVHWVLHSKSQIPLRYPASEPARELVRWLDSEMEFGLNFKAPSRRRTELIWTSVDRCCGSFNSVQFMLGVNGRLLMYKPENKMAWSARNRLQLTSSPIRS